ncbi:MAG: PaaI family thioesterase, partial [Hyphomicrobiales bacterium]|nr:PaaI family thioesterase [Hyphomicrobiales bacterium]
MSDVREIVYGALRPQDIVGLSGRQVLQRMIEGRLPAPPIAERLGFLLVEVGEGVAVFEGDTGPQLLNPLGVVHGGWA